MLNEEDIEKYIVLAKLSNKRVMLESVDGVFCKEIVGTSMYRDIFPVAVVEQYSNFATDGYNLVPLASIDERFTVTVK